MVLIAPRPWKDGAPRESEPDDQPPPRRSERDDIGSIVRDYGGNSVAPAPGPKTQSPAGSIIADAARRSNQDSYIPVPVFDKSGQKIYGASGNPLERPFATPFPSNPDLDPAFFAKQGADDSNVPIAIPFDLFKFRRGGEWDAQRLEGDFQGEYRDYATVAIGIYGAAAGLSVEDVLAVEDLVASVGGHYKELPDPDYVRLPSLNVENTRIGYDLYKSGRITPDAP